MGPLKKLTVENVLKVRNTKKPMLDLHERYHQYSLSRQWVNWINPQLLNVGTFITFTTPAIQFMADKSVPQPSNGSTQNPWLKVSISCNGTTLKKFCIGKCNDTFTNLSSISIAPN